MATTQQKQVPDHVLALLDEMEASGNLLKMHPRKLERADYEAMNVVVAALGGKTKGGKTKAHVFPIGTDVPALIDTVLSTGRYEDPKDADFIETPVVLAEDLVHRAFIKAGDRVLEPSAGHGRIALAARKAGATVHCIELSGARFVKLKTLNFSAINNDFLDVSPSEYAHLDSMFDAVVMNPPCSKQQDIRHVRHAYSFLRRGGCLVSVMSAGVVFRENKLTTEFREWVRSLDGCITELPDGCFKNEGTMVRSVIVRIVKPQ